IQEFINYVFIDSSVCNTIDSTLKLVALKVNNHNTFISSYLVNMGDTILLTFGSKLIFIKDNKIIEEVGIEGNTEIISVLNNGNEIWLGTIRRGIFVYSKNNQSLRALKVLEHQSVTSILRINKEKIIVGTLNNGLKIIKKNKILNMFDSISFVSAARYPNLLANSQTKIYSVDIPNRKIKTLFNYKEGISKGLVEWSKDTIMVCGNKLISINQNNSVNILSYGYITCIKKTDKRTYIGYPYSRIDIRDNKLNYTGSYKILKNNRASVIQEYKNKLYFGTRDGLFIMNDTSKSIVEKINDNRITSMYRIDDNVFIGTRFNGLIIMKYGLLEIPYTFGCKSLEIKGIIGENNSLYLSTNYGLIIAEMQNDSIIDYRIISKSDGLKSSIVNNALLYGDSIIMCTNNGIYIVQKDYQPFIITPNIYLENVKYLGKVGESEGKVVLRPYDNAVIIKYGSSTFDLESNVDFYYRVINDGIQWHKVTTQRLSIYNLSPGIYDFELYAQFKNKKSKMIKLSFFVDKPFYLKWYSILSLIIIIGSIFTYFILYRINKKKMVVRLLQNELDMIQKQLNPHFVSNALNSLQSLILDDDFVKTNMFISNFSSLLKFSLRYSKKLFIGLNEELNYIESFIKLHQITNRKTFKYYIYLSDSVEAISRDILVPPFFIQPIIENAIVHGFDDSNSKNILIIEVVEIDKYIDVRIVDNGIGIGNVTKNEQGSGRGIGSIQERITIYKDLEDYDIKFSINNSDIQEFGTIAQLSFEKLISNERKI
ncbi:MAG: hypothetical protein DRI86_12140, partial [Bacteroidetes bacterium]